MLASEAKRTTRQASFAASPRRMRHALFSSGRSSTFNVRADMKIFVIANVLCIWMAGATQVESFERRAISSAQRGAASDLDEALPKRPFLHVFHRNNGAGAGVVGPHNSERA